MSQDRDSFLTVEEAAKMVKCHPQTIRNAMKSGLLSHYRPSNKVVRIRLGDLLDYMMEHAKNFGPKRVARLTNSHESKKAKKSSPRSKLKA